VIDSADLPLNISRESMQDSALLRKLGQVMTGRLLKFLTKQAKDDPDAYRSFHGKFARFLKEGIVAGPEHRETLAGLLRFESSLTENGEPISFSDYVTRAKEGQEAIYYLVGSSREVIEGGPYLEAFKERGIEVAFFTEAVDQFVLDALAKVGDTELIPADRADIDLEDTKVEGDALDEESTKALSGWLKETLGESVKSVAGGKRLVDSPVVALVPADAPNAHMRAMMQAMGQDVPEVVPDLEINPRHPLIQKLATLRDDNPDLAEAVGRQLADQAMLAAGLIEHPQQVAARMNELLTKALG